MRHTWTGVIICTGLIYALLSHPAGAGEGAPGRGTAGAWNWGKLDVSDHSSLMSAICFPLTEVCGSSRNAFLFSSFPPSRLFLSTLSFLFPIKSQHSGNSGSRGRVQEKVKLPSESMQVPELPLC